MKNVFTVLGMMVLLTMNVSYFVHAQIFTNYSTATTSTKLSNNYIKAMATDAQGYKWIGTIDGLSRFDGTSWTTYTEKDGLGGNIIFAIAIDDQGDVWVASSENWVYPGSGVSKFDGTTWTTYTMKSAPLPSIRRGINGLEQEDMAFQSLMAPRGRLIPGRMGWPAM